MISKLSIFESIAGKHIPNDIIDEIKAKYLSSYLRIPVPNEYFNSDMVDIWKEQIDGLLKDDEKHNLKEVDVELHEPVLTKYKGGKIMYEARDFYIVYSPDNIEDKKLYDKFQGDIFQLVSYAYNDRLVYNSIIDKNMIFALVYMYVNIKNNISKFISERRSKDIVKIDESEESDDIINGITVIDGINYDVVGYDDIIHIMGDYNMDVAKILISGYSENIRNFINSGSWGEGIYDKVRYISRNIINDMGIIDYEDYF